MKESANEVLYRRVNLLNSLMISGWLLLVLAVAIIAILLYGQIRQVRGDIQKISRSVGDLSGRVSTGLTPPRPNAEPARATQPDNGTRPNGRTAAAPPPGRTTSGPSAEPAPKNGNGGTYNVSPTDGLPTSDPNRPPGLPGLFHDLKTSSVADPDSPMVLMVTGPITVRDALAELAKVDPAEAAKVKVSADDRVVAAQLFLQAFDAEQAHRWAAAAAKEAAGNGRAWLFAGLASMKLKQYPLAITELTAAVEKLPGRPEPLKALGEAHFGANQLDPAIAAYQKALAATPKDLAIGSRLAELYIQARKVDAAIAQLKAVLAEDAKLSAQRASLARLLVGANKTKEALAVLDATPANAPNDVRLHLARGEALLFDGDLPGAEAALEKAVDLDSLSAEGWHFLGRARLNQRKNASAVAAFERAIAIDSTMAASWEYLGVALANDGKPEEAISRLQEAVRLNAGSAQTHYIMALLFVRQNQLDSAAASLKQAAQLDASYLERARNEARFSSLPADSPVGRVLQAKP